MPSRGELLDRKVDALGLRIRTHDALIKRFGSQTLIREIAMLSQVQLWDCLQAIHKNPGLLVNEIKEMLSFHGLSLGMSWADLPPSKHAVVRNPRQMIQYQSN